MELAANRFISPEKNGDDTKEGSLRPTLLNEFIGQDRLKRHLDISLNAAKKREESVEHILLHGPPGLGKTTLASIIAHEMQVNFKITSGPAIERPGDLAAILTNLEKGDILFIDEIHRLNRAIEEVLYSAMEDFQLDIIIGKGPSARSIRLDLPAFTLIGATTRIGLLSAPLRDRFGIAERLEFYTPEQLREIIFRAADILQTKIDAYSCLEIARRSRGTPRIANRLLKRVRDWALIKAKGVIDKALIDEALESLGVDRLGLDEVDRHYLRCLVQKFGGGPVGIETLSAAISEETDTLEDVYEPYLLQLGFIERTPRGRLATGLAYQHLGVEKPEGVLYDRAQRTLFS